MGIIISRPISRPINQKIVFTTYRIITHKKIYDVVQNYNINKNTEHHNLL